MKLADIFKTDKKQELAMFVFLTVLLAPIATVLLVSGYGFIVWFSQLLTGPPTG